jgi:hypothetical protein
MRKSSGKGGLALYMTSLATLVLISLLALATLLALPESDQILNDILYWTLLFLWNALLLFFCIAYRAAYLKYKGWFRSGVIFGSLATVSWLITMVLVASFTFVSPYSRRNAAPILSCVAISSILVIVSWYLFVSGKCKKYKGP